MEALLPAFEVVCTFIIWQDFLPELPSALWPILWQFEHRNTLIPHGSGSVTGANKFSYTFCISASSLYFCCSFVSTDLSKILFNAEDVGFTSWCVEDSWNSEKVN